MKGSLSSRNSCTRGGPWSWGYDRRRKNSPLAGFLGLTSLQAASAWLLMGQGRDSEVCDSVAMQDNRADWWYRARNFPPGSRVVRRGWFHVEARIGRMGVLSSWYACMQVGGRASFLFLASLYLSGRVSTFRWEEGFFFFCIYVLQTPLWEQAITIVLTTVLFGYLM